MPLRRMLRHFRVRPLAWRLLVYVLLYSLILSVVATGVQIYSEFQQQREELQQAQARAAKVIMPSLVSSLENRRISDVQHQLTGLLELPGLSYARVTTANGRVFSVGKPLGRHQFEQEFSIRSSDPNQNQYGTLDLVSSLTPIYDALRERAFLTLILQSIIVLVGTLGLLLIVRLTLTRHLEAMADYASRLNFDALIAPLRLKRRERTRNDELSELERALNSMRVQLLDEARRIRESELQSQSERDIAIRANRAKNLFLANVSHELRTPLQSVVGYATLLGDTQLDAEQRDYVETLQRSAENLASIINDLLDVSRMEAGKMELEEIDFDLRDTLNDVVVMLSGRAREKGLALELRIDDDLPVALLGDPVRVRQALLNLVSNAIKFTDSGHVMLSAEVLRRENGNVTLRLSVEDTGVGIAPDELELIYEPYIQLAPQARRPLSGAGLGLTITRQLVTLMNGRLEVRSTLGQGSTFWIELALPVASTHSARVRVDTSAVHGRRLLIADSYALSRKITLEMLARHEAQLDSVRTASDTLQALQQGFENNEAFDVLILDGFLPDMDTDRLCRRIRENACWRDLRILVLSSNPQRGDAEHFRQAGADGFLSKTLRESSLLPILQRLLLDRDQGHRTFVTRFSLAPATESASRVPPLPCSPLRVLVVEDNPVNLALTQRLLEKLGCTVVTATDGEEAVACCQAERFDVVFMDCLLPNVDGFEATRRLRQWEQDSGQPRTTVIALTASAMEKDEEKCLRAGMDAFIAKPVRIDLIRAVLEQFCQSAVDV